jgi:hypothetical protein
MSEFVTNFCSETPRERDLYEGLRVDGRMIKWILKK